MAATSFSLTRLVVAVLIAAALLACNSRTPDQWQVPQGFAGWVVVQYTRPECPPLPVSNGYKVLRVSAQGRLCTSDPMPNGEAFDKFEFVDPDGHTTEIDQRSLVWGGTASSTGRRFVFIGTEEQWRNSADTVTSLDERCSRNPAC